MDATKCMAARWQRLTLAATVGVSLLVGGAPGASADREWSWTLDKDKNMLAAPVPYLYDFEIDGLYKPSGTFKNPSDLFIDSNFHVWVADTGNNRVLEFDEEGNFLREVGTADDQSSLNAPEGVFIDDRSNIWIADRGNGRVVELSADGTFMRELGKPRSKLLEEEQVYQPSRLVVDKRGYIYVLNGGGDYRGIFLLDTEGEFRGFFGANRLKWNLGRFLQRTFTTEAQKKQISKVLPTHHANLSIDSRGYVYTVSPLAPNKQIKRLNSVGSDIYTTTDVEFGVKERRGNQVQAPQFVDVAVDEHGIVTALDFTSGRVYQYDQQANMLDQFAGRGNQRGRFELPQSVKVGREGRVYVLDANRNNIQVFRRTEFAELIQTGSQLYYDGKYEEASKVWREVLRRDSNYELAHTGLAKADYKRGDYRNAMVEYEIARNKDGYSLAFGEWRHDFLRENFGWVLPLLALSIWLLAAIISRSVRKLTTMNLETEGGRA